MPLYAAAFFLPTSQSIPYLLEDVYLRGGFRTVATVDAMIAIKPASRKRGMMVYVQEDKTMYWIPGATGGAAAWHKWDATNYVNFKTDDVIYFDQNEDEEHRVNIRPERIVPVISEDEASHVLMNEDGMPVWVHKLFVPDIEGAIAGQAVVLDAEGKAVWGQVDGLPSAEGVAAGSSIILDAEGKAIWGRVQSLPDTEGKLQGMVLALDAELKPIWGYSSGLPSAEGIEDGSVLILEGGKAKWADSAAAQPTRIIENVNMTTLVVASSADNELQLNCTTAVLVQVAMSHPDLLLEIHQTPDFTDTNPYKFRSSMAKLEDDGITFLEDATQVISRRYSIFSALAERKMYLRVHNEGEVSAEVVVTIGYVPMEK